MARVDYESAWTDLLELIASKPSHGQKELLAEAARIAARHRVPEDIIEQASRLLGRPIPSYTTSPETDPASSADREMSPGMDSDHRPPKTEGGHDGTHTSGRVTPDRAYL